MVRQYCHDCTKDLINKLQAQAVLTCTVHILCTCSTYFLSVNCVRRSTPYVTVHHDVYITLRQFLRPRQRAVLGS